MVPTSEPHRGAVAVIAPRDDAGGSASSARRRRERRQRLWWRYEQLSVVALSAALHHSAPNSGGAETYEARGHKTDRTPQLFELSFKEELVGGRQDWLSAVWPHEGVYHRTVEQNIVPSIDVLVLQVVVRSWCTCDASGNFTKILCCKW